VETVAATGFKPFMESVGNGIDAFGVTVIVVGAGCATLIFLARLFRDGAYRQYRQNLARAILLGLELLIAGDIIRTVAVDPTMENAAVLGVIVLIRTFLSTTLQLEVEGRWPWQQEKGPEKTRNASDSSI